MSIHKPDFLARIRATSAGRKNAAASTCAEAVCKVSVNDAISKIKSATRIDDDVEDDDVVVAVAAVSSMSRW